MLNGTSLGASDIADNIISIAHARKKTDMTFSICKLLNISK